MIKTHYFIAVTLEEKIKEQLAKWSESVKSHFPFRTWVHQQDYHITLAFLGETPTEKGEAVCEKLHEIGQQHERFSLTLAEIGIFGQPRAPRILWQTVEQEQALIALRNDVYGACEHIGFTLDARPFAPHITIARKWQGEEEFSLEKLKSFERVQGCFTVKEVILYRTHLDRVPKYEAIALFPLSH
ncbi:2'-5' RNA ligase [Anoxybacillus sp. B7M1]|jgi:RNA 2',3'-cyclic 3'-phosphodiesterase|uniref:RNA 2',3'-cyclic phosphodiesterase n=1 Tax=Anoxybacteroides rupiense TaxID=311460 RepID=A0ABD5ITL1_9BACL|nr:MULTISPECIES: RNA 2',3'-cyclic phosphodiesterase [Anoxybacillus]ANB58724.1 2'-5' RNA ligase [Anoxybacillus sp. B2M1]ANB62456.1 2'-5' RNA ligase [Anoxybacillus sp. B7M1]MBS2771467.1 RNA 2',3'-cyclic phosphodiesterase [Anoxybacillus rupiensis]MDE8564690.1 RNA 2',3'-cyclic phosphodiesterase [Anoxybacillus rupiensis]MED5051208.1 RNA 2',3'-cyclic phosphodiesterase [Anoxybacillus rupiensis]